MTRFQGIYRCAKANGTVSALGWWHGERQGASPGTTTRREDAIMLVLTRKRNETIQIGQDIVIRVIHTSTGAVKIGIEAPREVSVVRGELAQQRLAAALGSQGMEVSHEEAATLLAAG
ncbi:carbon storage regulator [Planctopirus hydrillae]|nr:carbon storage regulator [Planctopirus hydrillae]